MATTGMRINEVFELKRESDGAAVPVRLRLMDRRAAEAFVSTWQPLLRKGGAQDAEWPWLAEYEQIAASGGRDPDTEQTWEMLQLATDDGEIHGLCSFKHPVTALLGETQRLLYVERLAAAPWNRPAAKPTRKALGCGASMLRYALRRSVELGFDGRLGLHSLNDPSTHGFYEKLGMAHLGENLIDGENLRYYEFDEEGGYAALAKLEGQSA
jgi:GNAT superfamily N-acetyltransferase